MKSVIVQLVTFNGEKYIPYLFESLRKQKFVDWELWVFDNASSDRTVELIREELKTLNRPHRLIESKTNIGFAPGHNKLFTESMDQSLYIMLLNQDMMLDSSFIDTLFYFAEAHPDAGAVSGRLMKWAFPEKTNIVDSIGLKAFKNHRVIDRAGGETWRDVDDDVNAKEVFGVSGALPMYRVIALREVAFEGQIFDEDFFMYKEDVDLAWRLKSTGWCAFSVFDAIAFHDRSASGPPNLSDRAAAKNRKNKSAAANKYSYRNHILMLIKNYAGEGGVRGFLMTVWYEFKKSAYFLLTSPTLFVKSWGDVLRLLRRTLKKRAAMQKVRSVSQKEMNQWFV
ncbi:MAG: glycosyltransferase family 2 protein [Candidatus Magasanikbacteria bacterium]|nr:glycosyltransferase family 2 protein [Candidatus Magasanikbacteria bacterium]